MKTHQTCCGLACCLRGFVTEKLCQVINKLRYSAFIGSLATLAKLLAGSSAATGEFSNDS